MDSKKSPTRRSTKRNSNKIEDNDWDCSVCTYKNTPEAFKCLMCDVRKGTSTRKPRLNSALAAQQAATLPAGTSAPLNGIPPISHKTQKSQKNKNKYKKHTPRLMNVDRSTAQTREVTVNSVTVVITEYRPKVATNNRRASSEYSFISESTDSRS